MKKQSSDKHISSISLKKIRDILLLNWDPIGINNIPEAADEYDSYVTDIYKLLIKDSKPDEIIKYLNKIEVDNMGLSPNAEKQKTTVNALLKLNVLQ